MNSKKKPKQPTKLGVDIPSICSDCVKSAIQELLHLAD